MYLIRLLSLALIAGLFGTGVIAPPQASAQEEERRKPETRKAESLDKETFDRLTEAQLLISPEEPGMQPNYAAAERILRGLLNDEGLSDYGKALAWQTMGFSRAEQEQYGSAIDAFESALRLNALPPGNAQMLQYNVGQLYMAEERYQEAVQTLEAWFALPDNTNPPSNAYILLGSAYAQLEQYQRAITPIRTAIERSINEQRAAREALAEIRGRGTAEEIQLAEDRAENARGPQESWYQLLLSMHLELEQWGEANDLLEFMVDTYPQSSQIKTYWGQLGAIRAERNDEEAAFAILDFQEMMGMLDKSDEWERLAQLYMFYEVPYIAAQIIEEGFDNGILEREGDNFEMLANAWFNARDYERAIEPLSIAAGRSEDGELHYRLGQALYEQRQMPEAAEALAESLRKGGLSNPCNVRLLLGIVQNDLDNQTGALQSFERAARDDRCAEDANSWIRFVQQAQRAREET